MEIKREVYADLVTLAEAGVASPETLKLIELCQAAHPNWEMPSPITHPGLQEPAPPAAVERASLALTQTQLARRTWLMFFGILLCAMPMSFRISADRVTMLLFRDYPIPALLLYVAGLLCWAGFVSTSRRLTVAGLARSAGSKTRMNWALGATAVSLPAAIMVSTWTGQGEPLSSFVAAGLVGVAAAIGVGRVRTSANQPL